MHHKVKICDSQLYVHLARLWYPVAWSNTSIDVSIKVFMDVINIDNELTLSRADTLHDVSGSLPSSWRPSEKRLRFLKVPLPQD